MSSHRDNSRSNLKPPSASGGKGNASGRKRDRDDDPDGIPSVAPSKAAEGPCAKTYKRDPDFDHLPCADCRHRFVDHPQAHIEKGATEPPNKKLPDLTVPTTLQEFVRTAEAAEAFSTFPFAGKVLNSTGYHSEMDRQKELCEYLGDNHAAIHGMQPEKEHRDCRKRRTEIDPVWDLVLSNTPTGLESTYAPLRLAAGSNLLRHQGSEPLARTEDLANEMQRQEACSASDKSAKEYFPISAVISTPRAGKSRLLDEFAKKCLELPPLEETKEFTASERKSFAGFFPVPITYNSDTGVAPVDGRHPVASFFWRALHSVLRSKIGEKLAYATFCEKYPGWTSFTRGDFFSMLHHLWPDSLNSRVVFIVDEFNKLVETTQRVFKQDFPEETSEEQEQRLAEVLSLLTGAIYNLDSLVVSGFTPAFVHTLATYSGRPTKKHFIPLIDHATRGQYLGFNDRLEHYYGSKGEIPKYLYEVLKSSAGLMGRWVEVCNDKNSRKTPLPKTITDFDTPWGGHVILKAERLHPLAVSYFTSWASNDKLHEALESMAKDRTPLAVYEEGGSIVPHPYPFAVLANKMQSSKYMWYILAMEKIAETLTLTATDGSVPTTVKGDVLERTVCLALVVKADGMGTDEHVASDAVDAWLGKPCFGVARPTCKVTSKPLAKYRTPSSFIDSFIYHLKAPVTSFPYVKAESEGAKGKSVNATVKDVLNTNAILYPSDPNNRGADVISVWDVVGGGLFLTMVECKFTKEVDSGRFTKKVLDALSSEVQANAVEWNVKHIAYCVVGAGAVCAPTTTSDSGKKITERIKSWDDSGITVTIHVRQGVEGLRQFLTPVLYHLMPESEGSLRRSTAVPHVRVESTPEGRAAAKQKGDRQQQPKNEKAGPTKSNDEKKQHKSKKAGPRKSNDEKKQHKSKKAAPRKSNDEKKQHKSKKAGPRKSNDEKKQHKSKKTKKKTG